MNRRMYTMNGRTQCIADWLRELRIPQETFYARIRRHGFTVEQALTAKKYYNQHVGHLAKPTGDKRAAYVTIDGETLPKSVWYTRFGVSKAQVQRRMRKLGLSFEEAVKLPKRKRCAAYVGAARGKVKYQTIYGRIRRGWDPVRAASLPAVGNGHAYNPNVHHVTIDGETLSYQGWSKKLGLSVSSFGYRVKHGWSAEEAMVPPLLPKEKIERRWARNRTRELAAMGVIY